MPGRPTAPGPLQLLVIAFVGGRFDGRILESYASASMTSSAGVHDLTPAELRVLRYLPTHLSFPEIAGQVFVSPNTVKTQAQGVYRKLGVNSRREAVEQARAAGLLDLDDAVRLGE